MSNSSRNDQGKKIISGSRKQVGLRQIRWAARQKGIWQDKQDQVDWRQKSERNRKVQWRRLARFRCNEETQGKAEGEDSYEDHDQ
jgi:hypothetical protein